VIYLRTALASAVLVSASVASAADSLCQKLKDYAEAQWSERGDPVPRYWVEFHWGFEQDPNTFWSWGCKRSDDQASKELCAWLMENTSREFRATLPINVQKCMGYGFPSDAVTEWRFTEGEVRGQAEDGSWLVLEIGSTGMQPGESAVRISFDSVDRRLEPDELPPLRSLVSSDRP